MPSSRSEDEALAFLAEQQRRHESLRSAQRGRVIGDELRLGGESYRLHSHPTLPESQTVSGVLGEGTFLLNPVNRQQLGVAALAPGGAYEVLLVDTEGGLWRTEYGVVTPGLPQITQGILVYTTRVVHMGETEITARQPRDTGQIATEIVELIRRVGVDFSPGIVATAVLMKLEPHDLTDEEVMEVLQGVERRGVLPELLHLIHDQEFRECLHEKGVTWDYVFMNWEPRFNDSSLVFAGFVVGVGENLLDSIRLIAVLAGSPFSEELANERDEFFAAIKAFFENPIVMAQAGIEQLYDTFVDHLYNLRFFHAGRILGHVTITLLTLPSAIRSLPSAARAIARGGGHDRPAVASGGSRVRGVGAGGRTLRATPAGPVRHARRVHADVLR